MIKQYMTHFKIQTSLTHDNSDNLPFSFLNFSLMVVISLMNLISLMNQQNVHQMPFTKILLKSYLQHLQKHAGFLNSCLVSSLSTVPLGFLLCFLLYKAVIAEEPSFRTCRRESYSSWQTAHTTRMKTWLGRSS